MYRYSIYITNSITRGSIKEKRVDGTKKSNKTAKKAQITGKIFFSQINKNLLGSI